jgi:aspartate kinase
MLVVAKFGGSALSDAQDYVRVAGIICDKTRKGERIAAVVSATFGTTNELIAARSEKDFDAIFEKHARMAAQLGSGTRDRMESLRASLKTARGDGVSAFVQSFGERLSAILLEGFLAKAGVRTVVLDSEGAGIAATGSSDKGVADIRETRKNLQARLKPLLETSVVVLTGYYGISKKGGVVLFGRGGSDYSAAVIAACLGANTVEFWKDVPGFMSADPKIVGKARFIDALSFNEVEELGYLGARVMHPRAVLPLRGTSTRVFIKNVLKPLERGTVVTEKAAARGAKAVAGKSASIITVREAAFAAAPGMAANVFSALAKANVSVDLISTSEVDISFTTSPDETGKAVEALKEVEDIEEVTVERDVCRIGVVGEGLHQDGAPEVFSYLAGNSSDVRLVSQDAGNASISFVMPAGRMKACLNELHQKLIER